MIRGQVVRSRAAILFYIPCCLVLPVVCAQTVNGPASLVNVSQRHGSHRGHRKDVVVEISFLRSGGFAGNATSVQGKVRFDDTGAHVSSEDSTYDRQLTKDEAEQVQKLAASGSQEKEAPGPMRDGYQYDVKVVMGDGKAHKFTLREQAGTGGPGSLINWVQTEAQSIWEHRIASRR